ncbi:outer membrane protein [Mesorhizobium sp. INR15]|uniref:outer membrane protein n=1 Tax=Mesorhizobium sp. INR15 TaxID=2654248 RepID=UPI001896780B|nr:outer membrane protein [Mesorhizobium sp. INR15]QPC91913.1 outer membrane beta-barrel protein [Mesorhizobium sp. INR15]
MTNTLIIASAMILITGSAFAADTIAHDEAVPVEAGFAWSGLYAGMDFGYAAGKSSLFIGGTDGFDINPDGFVGGVHIGVNHELTNRFVLGAEADLTNSNVEGLTTITNVLIRNKLTWSGSARLRAGYAFDRTLPYITAGLAAARYEVTGIIGNGGATAEIPLHDDTHIGWTVGAGIEQAFTDKWIARAEYRYTDFGSKDLTGAAASTGASVDLKTNDVRVGLSYKF